MIFGCMVCKSSRIKCLLDITEDNFIPLPHTNFSYCVLIEDVGKIEINDLVKKIKKISKEHKICLINYGFNNDGFLINFRSARDETLFKLFWV